VENPETIADHTFGMAIISWLLAEKRGLNVARAIKIALSHDLCEVYAGDITPNLYYPRLPKEAKLRKKMLMKWARLSRKEKEKIEKVKFKKERNGLLKLIKNMPIPMRNEIFSSWLDFEKGISREGRFVNQLNRIETLVQSIQYFGTENVKTMTTWWEWAKEIVENPLLFEFSEVIQKKFYGKNIKAEKGLEAILEFILLANKLKAMPRLYWTLRNVKNPESVAGHIFTLAVAAWVLGSDRKEFSMEKLLKMALCHELSAVYTGDTTPYDRILANDGQKREEILKRMVRLSKKEKRSIFIEDYKTEKRSLEKLTAALNPKMKKEIIQLWSEYRTKSSPEGKFLSQLNTAAVLLQGLLYEKKDKNFSAAPLWEWAFEVVDNPLILDFLQEAKKEFYG
jgi:putative hydrolase of HD superfamily